MILSGIEPKSVFGFFEEICAIPHGSGNTRKISDFLAAFAQKRGLEFYQDEAGNVIIYKAAAKGYENAEAVILQGHIDMVCECAPNFRIDMEKEGLRLKAEGDFVFAEGTTLGGDDGIAVAMMLAILDGDYAAPRIEAVFTVDEEIGLIGANKLDTSKLCGKRMINIDSEEEGVFTVSCAGGVSAKCTLKVAREAFCGEAIKISVGGLAGGHSGVEIHKGRANSNLILGRVLYDISRETEIRLVCADGGSKDNAIPRQSEAVVLAKDISAAKRAIETLDAALKNEYALTDGEIFVKTAPYEHRDFEAMDKASSDKAIFMLCCLPNGVIEMSAAISGLVQTSLNLGILKTEKDALCVTFGIRSSIESQKEMLCERISCFMERIGGEALFEGDYAGWEYKKDSALRDLMVEVYKEQYKKEPLVCAIHAGLECGVFAGKIKDFDGISIGPDIKDIHTFSERLSISSTERVYKMIVEALTRMK